MKRRSIGLFVLLVISAMHLQGQALAEGGDKTAGDITMQCGVSVSSNGSDKTLLTDGKHSTAWTADNDSNQTVELVLPDDLSAAGLYVMWNVVPGQWSLEAMAEDGDWQEVDLGAGMGFINCFVTLNDGLARLRITTGSGWKCSIAEISIFSKGSLPQEVQVWQKAPDKADLMVVSAHPDDEHIYFGGTLPTYAGQRKKHTVVVYMTSSPIIRKFEALDGLWEVGVREYPVFLPLANKYTSTVDDAELAWDGLDNTVGLLVEQFRRFMPDVVVTHDLNGEYGHGAHKLTALAVTKAVLASGRQEKYPSSAQQYSAWQVKKCYLHLYGKNTVRMDWQVELPVFGGKTALQMAQAGYDLHVSQHFRERPILDSGDYDNSRFGLYYTAVGEDTGKRDFFENIPDQPKPTAGPAASPAPTAGPTAVVISLQSSAPDPLSDSVEAAASVPKGMRITKDSDLAIRVFLAFGAVAFLAAVLLAYRKSQMESRRQPHRRGSRSHGRIMT